VSVHILYAASEI